MRPPPLLSAAARAAGAALLSPAARRRAAQQSHSQQQQQHQQQHRRRRAPSRQMAAAGAAPAQDGGAAPPRVLSVQSSVVHGYVGNKAAVFPLQLLGFDVDPVHTVQVPRRAARRRAPLPAAGPAPARGGRPRDVQPPPPQFSNHTGYPTVAGKVFDGAHLTELLGGLRANGLLCHTHLLSGYIGSLSLLEAVAAAARELRAANPALTYVCDPVLGDEGALYVSPDLVEAYKSTLVPLADVLTPNQFEAELLSGLPVGSERDALAAAAALQRMGPHTVIITSMAPLPRPEYSSSRSSSNDASGASGGGASQPQPSEPQQQLQQQPDPQQQQPDPEQEQQQEEQGAPAPPRRGSGRGVITLLASTRLPQAPGRPSAFRLRIPQLSGYYTGTGDLLAALLLAWTHRCPGDLAAAVEAAVAGLQAVLRLTAAAAGPEVLAAAKGDRSAAAFRAKELRVVAGAHLLAAPAVEIRAEPLDDP
ncbi:hypothetical protein HT031_004836 [Scenedesmus sp. PABB004]|nr:hypothetical protein HT031_004836 [Scenedesmus sp. PABB004]